MLYKTHDCRNKSISSQSSLPPSPLLLPTFTQHSKSTRQVSVTLQIFYLNSSSRIIRNFRPSTGRLLNRKNLSLTLSHTLFLSLSLNFPLSRYISLSLSFYFSLSRSISLSFSRSISLSLSQFSSLSRSISLSLLVTLS